MESYWAYVNGVWVDESELKIAVDDVGFLLGATVTERLRTFGGKAFRLSEHLQRFHHSLQVIGLDADHITGQVSAAIPEFLVRNGGRIDSHDDWSIVAFATPGVWGAGQPSVWVHGFPLQFHAWAGNYDRGLKVVVSDVRQVPANCWPPELKCRSRMHYYLADLQAAQRQEGARAILLDQSGNVAEASTANVIAYRPEEGLVSPLGDHILAGVSLNVVQELAERLPLPFVRRNLTVEDLLTSHELMLCSTSVCVLPVVECNQCAIGSGRPGPTFKRMLKAWSELAGVDIAAQAKLFASRTTK